MRRGVETASGDVAVIKPEYQIVTASGAKARVETYRGSVVYGARPVPMQWIAAVVKGETCTVAMLGTAAAIDLASWKALFVMAHTLGPGNPSAPATPRPTAVADALVPPDAGLVRDPPKELWRVPLGAALLEFVVPVGTEKLLVGLRGDETNVPNLACLMIETASGRVLWRLERKDKVAVFTPVVVRGDLILFETTQPRERQLVAVDGGSGAVKWVYASRHPETRFLPDSSSDRMLVEEPDGGGVRLFSIAMSTGTKQWERRIAPARAPERGREEPTPPAPLLMDGDILTFYGAVERWSSSAEPRWRRADLRLSRRSDMAWTDGSDLFLIDDAERLIRVSAATGETIWRRELDSSFHCTAISPETESVYARGVVGEGDGAEHFIVSMRRSDGEIRWVNRRSEPSISNLIEADGRLVLATPTKVIALDASTGREQFVSTATELPVAFPVHLRLFANTIVFVGELAIAGFDRKTGARVYAHELTPLASDASLRDLDLFVPRLRYRLAEVQSGRTGMPPPPMPKSDWPVHLVRYYQRMSDQYGRSAANASTEGRRSDAADARLWQLNYVKSAEIQQSLNNTFERLESTLLFTSSIVAAAEQYVKAVQSARLEGSLRRAALMRRSIIASYAQTERGEYVARPNAKDSLSRLTVIHLPTGRRADMPLSVNYRGYGTTTFTDYQHQVVYHHGIGLDASRYEYSDVREVEPFGKKRLVNSFLLAYPARLPGTPAP